MRGAASEGDRYQASQDVGPDDVRAQLARILASADFDASERNRRFLSHIVEETLAGRGDRIKAYGIAIAVFERDDGFDPQSDPIVRIEASRLRRSLERYYLLAGKDDPLRIEIPKGGYVPLFRPQRTGELPRGAGHWSSATPKAEAASPEEMPRHAPVPRGAMVRRGLPLLQGSPTRIVVGLLGLLIVGASGLAASWFGWHPWSGQGQPLADAPLDSRPSLMVAPFEDLSSEPTDHFADGLAQEVSSNLIRFKEFVVFDARTSLETAQTDPLEFGRQLGADYVVTGTVRRDAGRVRVSSQLVELASGASIWAANYDDELAVNRLFEIQDGIAASVAAAVAQPYGVVHRDARDRLQRYPPDSLSAYECLLQAYAYRRRIAPEPHAQVRDCLEEAVIGEPDYADAQAMLAMVYVDEFRWGFNARPDQYDPLDRALEMAQRAVELAPDGAVGWVALFETEFFRGELDHAFAAGERAIALNPNNPELKALVGMRIAETGQWGRGVAMVEEALALNPAPPGWYHFPLSVGAFRQGHDDEALHWAQKIDLPGLFWTHVLLAAIYGQLDRKDDAARAAARLLEVYPDFEQHALIELGRIHLEPAVRSRVIDGLRKAGLDIPEPAAAAGRLD